MFNSVLRVLVVSLSLAASLSCSSSPPKSVETTNATGTPAASPDIGRIQKAKALIDENIEKTIPLMERIESAGKDRESLQSMRQSIVAELEPLAIKEAEMYLSMTPDERFEAYQYMLSRLGAKKAISPMASGNESSETREEKSSQTARDRFLNALESLTIEVNRTSPSRESFNDPPSSSNRQTALQDLGPRRANCIGFFVGHRRCCANNAGNGVCGGAPIDCYGSKKMISDSCPQCNWCQY